MPQRITMEFDSELVTQTTGVRNHRVLMNHVVKGTTAEGHPAFFVVDYVLLRNGVTTFVLIPFIDEKGEL